MRIFERTDFNRPTITTNEVNTSSKQEKENSVDKNTATESTKDSFDKTSASTAQRAKSFIKGEKHSGDAADTAQPRNVRRRGRFRKAIRNMFKEAGTTPATESSTAAGHHRHPYTAQHHGCDRHATASARASASGNTTLCDATTGFRPLPRHRQSGMEGHDRR